jgi:hypothetical protein
MTAQVIKPTDSTPCLNGISVFLAGSIEMGVAEDWQTDVAELLSHLPVTFYNPRRDSWDSSWVQKQSNIEFNHQVNWELNKLEECDIVFMYILPESKAPISLMELGYVAAKQSDKIIVCCPDGFWRKGNIEVLCTRLGVPLYSHITDAIGALITKIKQKR